MGYILALAATGLLGFLAGLLSFKVKSRWCPSCGVTLIPGRPPLKREKQVQWQ